MIKVKGYAAQQAAKPMAPFQFDRCELPPNRSPILLIVYDVCYGDKTF